eukprot:XP_014782842.1 PREDICTED: uncharacterized protein LOC106878211 [Octopus bimaculoides]
MNSSHPVTGTLCKVLKISCDVDEQENRNAFLKHFEEQLNIYEKIAVITLVELTGKEQVIGNAYLDRILDFNSKDIIYITFDFHEYCGLCVPEQRVDKQTDWLMRPSCLATKITRPHMSMDFIFCGVSAHTSDLFSCLFVPPATFATTPATEIRRSVTAVWIHS